MARRLSEHLLAILLVTLLFGGLIIAMQGREKSAAFREDPELEQYLLLDFIEFDDPLHRALFSEALDNHPEGEDGSQRLEQIDRYRQAQMAALTRQVQHSEGLSARRLSELAFMYFKFILAYFLVMLLSYYGVQTLGVWRFIQYKRGYNSYLARLFNALQQPEKKPLQILNIAALALLRGIAYFVLFSPAYVIAYSFKPGFSSDSFLFMIILGVISNALLITYGNKFFTFLLSEGTKGYIDTARVKNLNQSWEPDNPAGVSLRPVFALRKQFTGHVLQHIYINARYQYLATLKEQASFVITGLIIIEMALNIQGHLCYELLQNILFKQYDIILIILLGIFLVVKATDILADLWYELESRRYENERPA